MLKGKFAVLSLAAAALLCLQVAGVETVNSGVVDPCNSSASGAAGVIFACPQSDGDLLSTAGLTISVTVLDNVSAPVVGVPAADIWLIGCSDLLNLCGGSGAINASAATDVNGQTTITGDIAAGGCDLGGVRVVVQGVVIGAGVCADPCVLIKVKSADINASLLVNLVDFATFGAGYTSPPKVYNECIDFTSPFGTVTLPDFAKYGSHNNHTC
ncbi:MAG: hypothetical protein ACREXT_07745 [Gammaproteobacteria bacterium]